MYPIYEQQLNEVLTYKKKFKCVDRDELEIWGDYNSPKAQQLAFKFKMCEGVGCASKDTILEWLAGKYIVLLYNQIRFDQARYFEQSRVREARISYIPVSSQSR